VFKDCKAPVSAATLKLTSGLFNVPTAADAASCSAALGRACEINSLSGSGDFGSFADAAAVNAIGKADSVWKATSADDVIALKTSAGVGKLGSGGAAGAKVKIASAASVSSLATIVATTTMTKTPAATHSAASTVSATAAESTANSAGVVSKWGRCGGNGWTGATSCERGSSCTVINVCEYFCFSILVGV
jgi:hypothetical protein